MKIGLNGQNKNDFKQMITEVDPYSGNVENYSFDKRTMRDIRMNCIVCYETTLKISMSLTVKKC